MPTRHKGSAKERRALDVFIKLSRANESVAAKLYPRLGDSGITAAQFGVLDALFHIGPMSLGDLAKKHLRSPHNLSSVVDTMERNGLVVREKLSDDRRCVHVVLTEKGRDLFENLWPCQLAAITELFGTLTVEEQETLAALCKKLGRGAGARG